MLEVLGGHCPTQLHSPTFLVWHRPGVFAEGEFCLIQSLELGGALEGLELGPEQELLELFRGYAPMGMPGRGTAKELFSDCEQSFGRLSICSHHRDFSMSSTLSFIWLVIFKSTHLLKLETTFKGVFCLFTCQNKCVKCG